jgi:hypothetical protein
MGAHPARWLARRHMALDLLNLSIEALEDSFADPAATGMVGHRWTR